MIDDGPVKRLPSPPRNTHWLHVGELAAGRYFKMNNAWYLVTRDARDNRHRNDGFDWTVAAIDTNGWDVERCVHGTRAGQDDAEYVLVNDDGVVPGPFRPASLRRKAGKLRAKAATLDQLADMKARLAARLENAS